VLDTLEMHPEIISELERVGNMLLLSNTAPELLWDAAVMRYNWITQTAEWLQQEQRQRDLYAAQADLKNAQLELQSIQHRLESERYKKKRSEDAKKQKKEVILPSSQVAWYEKEERAARKKVEASRRNLEGITPDSTPELSALLEDSELRQVLHWAKTACAADCTLGSAIESKIFLSQVESLLQGSET
jgi:hypothetical protein